MERNDKGLQDKTDEKLYERLRKKREKEFDREHGTGDDSTIAYGFDQMEDDFYEYSDDDFDSLD